MKALYKGMEHWMLNDVATASMTVYIRSFHGTCEADVYRSNRQYANIQFCKKQLGHAQNRRPQAKIGQTYSASNDRKRHDHLKRNRFRDLTCAAPKAPYMAPAPFLSSFGDPSASPSMPL
ncbi:hypothetical protein Ddc_08984 [Ditylenchus destructor]|nr:hypothetical protein Ddc_08984 [Ditylenchus destructor]